MKYIAALAPFLAAAAAAPVGQDASSNAAQLEKRGAMAATIISGVASSVVSEVISEVVPMIVDITHWDDARENFVKNTVREMWKKRSGDNEAAICYNMGYAVSDTTKVRELSTVEFKLGSLMTDYDCFFMSGPDNHFNSQGDGGYINLGVMSNDAYCTFDGATDDVYCK